MPEISEPELQSIIDTLEAMPEALRETLAKRLEHIAQHLYNAAQAILEGRMLDALTEWETGTDESDQQLHSLMEASVINHYLSNINREIHNRRN